MLICRCACFYLETTVFKASYHCISPFVHNVSVHAQQVGKRDRERRKKTGAPDELPLTNNPLSLIFPDFGLIHVYITGRNESNKTDSGSLFHT